MLNGNKLWKILHNFTHVRLGKVMENLLYLRDTFGAHNIFINFTLKKPAFSEVKQIKPFFKDLGIDNVQISPDIYDEQAKALVEAL